VALSDHGGGAPLSSARAAGRHDTRPLRRSQPSPVPRQRPGPCSSPCPSEPSGTHPGDSPASEPRVGDPACRAGYQQWFRCRRARTGRGSSRAGRWRGTRDGWLREAGEYRAGPAARALDHVERLRRGRRAHYVDGELKAGPRTWNAYPTSRQSQEEIATASRMSRNFVGRRFWSQAVEKRARFQDGQKHGGGRTGHPNARKAPRREYAADELHGPTIIWDEDGRSGAEGQHVRKQRDGWWTFWDASGGAPTSLSRRRGGSIRWPGAHRCRAARRRWENLSKLGREEFGRRMLAGRSMDHARAVRGAPIRDGAKRGGGSVRRRQATGAVDRRGIRTASGRRTAITGTACDGAVGDLERQRAHESEASTAKDPGRPLDPVVVDWLEAQRGRHRAAASRAGGRCGRRATSRPPKVTRRMARKTVSGPTRRARSADASRELQAPTDPTRP